MRLATVLPPLLVAASSSAAFAQTCEQSSALDRATCAKNLAVMSGDPRYCALIEDSELDQQDCYAMLARLTGTTLCDGISDEFARDNCENQGRLGEEERAQREGARLQAEQERDVQRAQLELLEEQLAAQEEAQANLVALLERQATLLEQQTELQGRLVDLVAPESDTPGEPEDEAGLGDEASAPEEDVAPEEAAASGEPAAPEGDVAPEEAAASGEPAAPDGGPGDSTAPGEAPTP